MMHNGDEANMLEKTTKINMLYDFYHTLLTEKQRSYMEMYYREDYSLGEISELSKVSRQAVYDTIRRAEELLIAYEEKLLLYEKFKQRSKLLQQLHDVLNSQSDGKTALEIIDKLQKID